MTNSTPRPFQLLLAASAFTMVLAACSASSRPPAALAPPSTTTATASAVTSTSPSTSAAPSVGSTTPSVVPQTTAAPSGRADRCHTSQLAATDDGGKGYAGTFYAQFGLRNISGQTCTMFGYPGLQLLDATRHFLPTKVDRSPSYPPMLVTVAPQQKASFGYRYCGGCNQNSQGLCLPGTTAFVEVTPPDERDFLLVPTQIGPCDGHIEITAVALGKFPPPY